MEKVILLNADFSYLGTVSWQKAIRLMVKEKAEVIKLSTKVIRSAGNILKEIIIPKVLRLIKLVRAIYKNKVPFSKRNVMIRDNFICQYCGITEKKMTIDHVVPTSKSGKSTFENCTTSCKKCNNKKRNREPREANMHLKRQPWAPTIMEFIIIKTKNLGINKMLEDLCKP
jgi:5-methylcytosine-specific restriction endonuclease McrA